MIGLTFSVKMNKAATNIPHNNRTLTEEEYKQPAHEHIIREKSSDNIVIRQSTIQEAYKEVFGEAVEEYNAKQKRKDRQIKDYYKHVYHSKTLDLQREMILGLGNKEDWEKLGYEKKKEAGQLLREVIEDFIRDKKDHIHVYNAVVHLDEAGAPHAHINFIPLAHNYKNGLKTQPSWTKSLAQMGYPGKGRKPFMAFRETEVERIGRIAEKYGIERKLGETNPLPDVQTYKRVKDLEKQAKAKEAEIEGLEQEYSQKDRELKRQAQEQAQVLDDFNKRLESKVNEKEVELELLDSELSEKRAEVQGAGESAQRAQQEAQQALQAKEQVERETQTLRAEIERLRAEKTATESAIAAIDETVERKQAILDDVNQRFDERRYDFEKRQVMKRYNELTGVTRYSDRDVRPNTFKSDELIIKKEHYENLKKKASFFDRAWEIKDSLREIKDTLMQKINESFIVQGLKKTIKDLRKKVASLTKENESLKKEKEEHEIYLTFSQQQQVRYWIQQGKKNHEEALERMQREDERDFHHQPQRNQQRDRDEEERTIIDDWEER
ncbi:plasmid recombination protein [Streptococcus mitis]|uniref:plasmid recombination protein n=1 Tax=Streptococcus mitis TaxID=28037 RepID=UPI001F018769|nr:plasmid recombination protein [Streptococcus mitis]